MLATFRDPAGHLSLAEDHAVRTIEPNHRSEVLAFLGSPLCHRWEQSGSLVASTIENSSDSLKLRHPLVFFPSYHWEWTISQWHAAAKLTLTLCEEALAEGWIMKDATPTNILFAGTEPVFVDVLSFERRDLGSPLWLAYSQFVRTFILPLLAWRWLGWSLRASLVNRDGYEPEDLYRALSPGSAFAPPSLLDRHAPYSSRYLPWIVCRGSKPPKHAGFPSGRPLGAQVPTNSPAATR